VQLEGLGELNKRNGLIRTRTHDLPACNSASTNYATKVLQFYVYYCADVGIHDISVQCSTSQQIITIFRIIIHYKHAYKLQVKPLVTFIKIYGHCLCVWQKKELKLN
jgi:hypothetical protein